MEVVPFTPEFVPAACELLAARHAADRERDPRLPRRFEAPDDCRPLVEAGLAGGCGVAALAGNSLAGYVIASYPPLHDPHRRGFIGLEGHAIARAEEGETYREMYAALAPVLLHRGIFDHQTFVQASDEATTDAWFSLGFGHWMQVASRGLEGVDGPSAEVDVRLAGPRDLEDIVRLFFGLAKHDTASPLFMPYVFNEAGWRRDIERDLEKSDRAFWLAQREGGACGVMYVGRPEQEGLFRPEGSAHIWEAFVDAEDRASGVGTALLRHCVAWARDNGYGCLTLDFRSFNLTAARFWLGHGFRPVASILERRIDPRIAWADGTNE